MSISTQRCREFPSLVVRVGSLQIIRYDGLRQVWVTDKGEWLLYPASYLPCRRLRCVVALPVFNERSCSDPDNQDCQYRSISLTSLISPDLQHSVSENPKRRTRKAIISSIYMWYGYEHRGTVAIRYCTVNLENKTAHTQEKTTA